jgi:hypothetical protein
MWSLDLSHPYGPSQPVRETALRFTLSHPSSVQTFSSAPCSQTLAVLCSSLNVRDQYKTAGKIIVWYILISVFRQQKRREKVLN